MPLEKEDNICRLCGFNLSQYERETLPQDRKRQWGQSFQFGEHWICGLCGDELHDRLDDN